MNLGLYYKHNIHSAANAAISQNTWGYGSDYFKGSAATNFIFEHSSERRICVSNERD